MYNSLNKIYTRTRKNFTAKKMGTPILVDSHSCINIKSRMFLIKRDLTKNT